MRKRISIVLSLIMLLMAFVAITACNSKKEVTVSFVTGTNQEIPAVTRKVGENYGQLPTPARADYSFIGWFTAETGGTEVTSQTKVTNEADHSLYARWSANAVTISFVTDTDQTFPAISREAGSAYGELPTPIRVNYSFLGWFTALTGGTKIVSETIVTNKSNHSLYARWEFSGQLPAIAASKIAAGQTHTLAIDENGSLWTWGGNSYGQLGDGTRTNGGAENDRHLPMPIKQNTKFDYVAACYLQSFAIDEDGNLWAWGNNGTGQLGDGTKTESPVPVQIKQGTKFSSVSAAEFYTIAIDIDGGLWAWGQNSYGQLGDGTTTDRLSPVQIKSDTKFAFACAGGGGKTGSDLKPKGGHTLAIDLEGNLWAWGDNDNGQLGDGTTTNKTTPKQIKQGTKFYFAAASAAENHSLAIDLEGNLWAFGQNDNGQLGDGTTTERRLPAQIKKGTKFSSVSAGLAHSLAIDIDGNLWAWGRNFYGQIGNGNSGTGAQISSPLHIKQGTLFSQVQAGSHYSFAKDSGGNLWLWGANTYGQLGDGTTTNCTTPQKLDPLGSNNVTINFVTGTEETVEPIVRQVGLPYFELPRPKRTGYSFVGWFTQQEEGTRVTSGAVVTERNAHTLYARWKEAQPLETQGNRLAAGSSHSFMIDESGNLWAWGYNNYGQLGDGTTTNRTTPVQIMEGTLFSYIVARSYHSLAIDIDGNLWAWGGNVNGQLGDGTTTSRTTPVQIMEDTKFSSVATGSIFSLAIDIDGNLYSWGTNGSGQLGDGTTTNRAFPAQIIEDVKFSQVSAGLGHVVAIDISGNLWAWGSNSSGQLGDGTTANKASPVQINHDTLFSSVSLGTSHTLALDTEGNLWAWGSNSSGQLGDGTSGSIAKETKPIQIMQGTLFSCISAGDNSSFAIDTDGNLWAWGSNYNGCLGDGTTTNRTAPVQIMQGTSFSHISVSGHTLALDIDGNLWAWGSNNRGQLGDGTTTNSSLPIKIEFDAV